MRTAAYPRCPVAGAHLRGQHLSLGIAYADPSAPAAQADNDNATLVHRLRTAMAAADRELWERALRRASATATLLALALFAIALLGIPS